MFAVFFEYPGRTASIIGPFLSEGTAREWIEERVEALELDSYSAEVLSFYLPSFAGMTYPNA